MGDGTSGDSSFLVTVHVGVSRWGEAGTKVQLLEVGIVVLDFKFLNV